MIDLRSDTVTRPTAAMRDAMANAIVGDDVLKCDPTAVALEEHVAELLGKEAAIFMPSGTMTNQVAVRLHCRPGDEFLCDQDCHIYNYEQGAFAQLSGVVAVPLPGRGGILEIDDVQNRLRPDNDHMVRTRLLCIENTHNRGGGRVQPLHSVRQMCDWAHANGLSTHLDGARIFNAAVAMGRDVADLAAGFDTVSVCFSKGLGAPVGSALAGDCDAIAEARRHRKLFGGGMRQSGIIAAAALHALRHHVARLADDHEKAQNLAESVRNSEGLTLVNDPVETNILFVDVDSAYGASREFVAALQKNGVAVLAESAQRLRMLTHLDVSQADVLEAGKIIQNVADQFSPR